MSNFKLGHATGAIVIAAAILVAGCSEKMTTLPNAGAAPGTTVEPDSRAQVIGVPPGGPTIETPGTTSTAKSDITKSQQATAMPLPGQVNDHSTLSPKATQKAAPPPR
jgi:PBP1b-binding outer membrane lipoprotein LpoB